MIAFNVWNSYIAMRVLLPAAFLTRSTCDIRDERIMEPWAFGRNIRLRIGGLTLFLTAKAQEMAQG